MNWKASPPAIESTAAWTAALCLGGAVGFAVAQLAPLGAGPVAAAAAGTLVTIAGGFMVRRIDRAVGQRRLPAADGLNDMLFGDGVVLRDDAVDDVLLLDDPLPPLDDELRVVRLFATPHEALAAPTPLAGPGEMIARIEHYLGQPRGEAGVTPAAPATKPVDEDANAALHAALADIRRSLKKG